MRRHQLVSDIFKHADKLGSNKETLLFLLATMNDKKLTKFHEEYLNIKG